MRLYDSDLSRDLVLAELQEPDLSRDLMLAGLSEPAQPGDLPLTGRQEPARQTETRADGRRGRGWAIGLGAANRREPVRRAKAAGQRMESVE